MNIDLTTIIGAIGVLFAVIFGGGKITRFLGERRGRRRGREETIHEFEEQTDRRVEAGREAIRDAADDDRSPDERVSGNDRSWK